VSFCLLFASRKFIGFEVWHAVIIGRKPVFSKENSLFLYFHIFLWKPCVFIVKSP
jgi:hypothetical protein